MAVSIHAPARGATPEGSWPNGFRRFQSTRPHGARHSRRAPLQAPRRFQSTRPHGARPSPDRLGPKISHVSIHAPARGATW